MDTWTLAVRDGIAYLEDGAEIPAARCRDQETAERIIAALERDHAAGTVERREAIVKEAWRFWAALHESAIESTLDRGYTILRVRTDAYQAFDALFRSGSPVASTGASDGAGAGQQMCGRCKVTLVHACGGQVG